KALSESAFNRAFAGSKYMAYSTQAIYLNDNDAFVEKLDGRSRYLLTILYEGKSYAIREYQQHGYVYCDDKADETFPSRIALTTADHNTSSIIIARSNPIVLTLRRYFDSGLFRFKNLKCKEVIMKLLSY
ncbi:MAG TPA: phage DNA encapsidation protein, partial [Pseudothermotoga sp.]